MSTKTEHWEVWYDVVDDFGHTDAEMKLFRSYKAAARFAAKHQDAERPAAVDHYVNGQLV